ncbi:hypothetical protein NG99_09605 [Erwinia typographi]|uniref:Type II secretion system protein J n=1 Tax=Erwinia typographi TaxID=371042 RepID=A0A0A3Z5P0_9GAMM|nr:type II secretion system minor pseudopilin GspJ [Erwinia typographi]KGT94397.1 hypothetical protein NG99_09605 [Erwinia typographi]
MARHNQQAGFTLLEMMLALALLAATSVIALQLFQGVLRSSALLREASSKLMQQQFAFAVMEMDFSQALLPPDFGEKNQLSTAAIATGDLSPASKQEAEVRFLRSNWLNPAGMFPRSQIEHVTYQLAQGKLQKVSALWPAGVSAEPPRVTTLLTGVSAFTLRYYYQNKWVEKLNMLNVLPKAVAVELEFADGGEFRRTFLLAED